MDRRTCHAQKLLPVLERKAGRVLVNRFPTGVEVPCHGARRPAVDSRRPLPVGGYAIYRFLRPVCYQTSPMRCCPKQSAKRRAVHAA
jgi:NADP-dependent aldehyde dehydrogenase